MSKFWQVHAIQQEIQRVVKNDPEYVLYGVWNAILTWQFPTDDRYVTRPQDKHTSQSGRSGFSDLHTYQYPPGPGGADKFLITQCKRPGRETGPATWRKGVDQLRQYLSNTHGTRQQAQRTPVYGIVAVGTYMRVYKYNDVLQDVEDWAPPGLVSGEARKIARPLYWETDTRDEVQRILDYIKLDH